MPEGNKYTTSRGNQDSLYEELTVNGDLEEEEEPSILGVSGWGKGLGYVVRQRETRAKTNMNKKWGRRDLSLSSAAQLEWAEWSD